MPRIAGPGTVDTRPVWRLSPTGLRAVVVTGAALLWIGGVRDAVASGFALREQSPSALGNAFAGSGASAADLSYMFFNPAGITRLSGDQALAGMSVILPQAEFKNGSASTASGAPITGGDGGNSVVPENAVPVFYALWDVQRSFDLDQNIKAGIGVNVPFALESDYADGWMGRYHALHSRILTVNVNPVVAYEVIDSLSVAAGLQVQYADARLSNAVDFGSLALTSPLLSRIARPGQQDGRASLDGDDVGYGYNFGILYEPWTGTRFGAAFRSEIDHNLRGDADFGLGNSGIGALISANSGRFVDGKASARVTTPWSASFSFHHDVSEQWSVMGTVERTGWNSFDEIRVKFRNPAQPDSVTDEDWNNSWFGAVGVTYRPTEAWSLRTGFAYDESPIPGKKRTPRVPTGDRAWFSVGAGYQPFPNVAFDFGYAHLFFQDADIDLAANEANNSSRGNLSGTMEASVDIISLQARIGF
ncbi:MAG: outer membrane protein transport protein [Rhodospirillales bacterium]